MTEPVADPIEAAPRRFAFLPEDRNQQILAGVLAVLAVVLLLFVATRLLGGGGGGGTDEAAAPAPAPAPAPAAPTTAPPVGTAESFETFTTKNPFTPLVGTPGVSPVIPSTGTGGGTGTFPTSGGTATTLGGGRGTTATTTGGGTTGGGGTSGGTGTSGGSGTTSGGGGGTTATTTRRASGGSATEPRRQERVALVDVFTEGGRVMANVRVNDTVHKVGEGETFAGSYKVVSLAASTECGRFLFGDDQFRLCRGEETLK